MTTRLVVCFDGTWDRPDDNPDATTRVESNVCRFYESVANGPVADAIVQRKWYEPGVGTRWYDRIRGGVFGLGIDDKIQEGYRWLVDHYPDPDPGDIEIFVTGFSRGAYTARSMIGMIRNIGLLKPENHHRVEEAYAIYRQRDGSADTPQAIAFRDRYSRPVEIAFLGVWDTVGALGIPLQWLQWLNAAEYAFHDTTLSGIVKHAAHAVAIDEHRIDYQATLWTPPAKPGQTIEQCWFIGAHADIGGGYADRRLSDITLAWMQQKAAASGVAFDDSARLPIPADNCLADPVDSYREFLQGAYAGTHRRFFRTLQLDTGLAEGLDASVTRRRQVGAPPYRPRNKGFPS